MQRRAFAAAVLFLLFASCGPFARDEVTLAFNASGDRVTITAATTLPRQREARDRNAIEHLREDLVAGRDAWSLRFANTNPDRWRTTLEHESGELVGVSRAATIDSADLQKFFYDVPISVTTLRGDGWLELTFIPGTPNRATRQQRDDAEKKLDSYSALAVAYFRALGPLYHYLNANRDRAHDVFTALFRDDDDKEPSPATEEETKLLTPVRTALEALANPEGADDLEHEADLVYNPFPGVVSVHVEGKPLIVEGFERDDRGNLLIAPKTLIESVAALEGRWVSPDPLATVLRSNGAKNEEIVAQLAAEPRRVEEVISQQDVAGALVDAMRAAPRYRVRFTVKAPEPSS